MMERALQLHGALKPPDAESVGIAQKKERKEGDERKEEKGVSVEHLVALVEPIGSLWERINSREMSAEFLEQKKSAIQRAAQQLKGGMRSTEEAALQKVLEKLLACCKMGDEGSNDVQKQEEEVMRLKGDLEKSLMASEELKSKSEKSVESLRKQLEEEERKSADLRKQVESLSSRKTEEVAQPATTTTTSSSSSNRQASLEAENSELKKEIEALKGQLSKAQAESRRKEAAAASSGGGEAQSLRQELLTLKGEMGMVRTQMEKTRQEQVASDVRLRAEREKVDDLNKVSKRRKGAGGGRRSEEDKVVEEASRTRVGAGGKGRY